MKWFALKVSCGWLWRGVGEGERMCWRVEWRRAGGAELVGLRWFVALLILFYNEVRKSRTRHLLVWSDFFFFIWISTRQFRMFTPGLFHSIFPSCLSVPLTEAPTWFLSPPSNLLCVLLLADPFYRLVHSVTHLRRRLRNCVFRLKLALPTVTLPLIHYWADTLSQDGNFPPVPRKTKT